jgi:hypothetical protein
VTLPGFKVCASTVIVGVAQQCALTPRWKWANTESVTVRRRASAQNESGEVSHNADRYHQFSSHLTLERGGHRQYSKSLAVDTTSAWRLFCQ